MLPGCAEAVHQVRRLVRGVSLDADDDEHLTYYDLTAGRAWWLSPLVFCGQHEGGIWHTGVVVHGKEYWFGGSIFESDPGSTPFGEPTEIVELPARTMRTRGDLWSFIRQELSKEYTHSAYDVLTHNCNHFSDAVCQFLINQHIPDDVLKQPERVMTTCTARLLRPVLNQMLGGFQHEGFSTPGDGQTTARRADERAVEEQ